MITMILLFLNEFSSFISLKTQSSMFVDTYDGSNKLPIQLNINLLNLPCSLAAIEFSDHLGARTSYVEGNLTAFRMDKKGKVIITPNNKGIDMLRRHHVQPNYEEVKKEIAGGYGCKLKGFFNVDRVPGAFHISANPFGPTIQRLSMEGLLKVNMDHEVKALVFGERIDRYYIEKQFNSKTVNTLKKIRQVDAKNKEPKVYQYYLKAVPSVYERKDKQYKAYDYTYNTNAEVSYNQFPSIYFKYDISPITVKYTFYRTRFLTFFIQCCAILGGVFTVTGIIDSMIHQSVKILLRKAEMNKLA